MGTVDGVVPHLKGGPQATKVTGVSEPLNSVEPRIEVLGEPVRLPHFAVALHSRFRATFASDPGLPYTVELELTYSGERVSCERMACARREGGPPVTSEGMLAIRVAELVYRAARLDLHDASSMVQPAAVVTVRTDFEVPPRPVGRAGPSEEHLRTVAIEYGVAYACAGHPRRAVMDAFGLSRTSANRWINQAREVGYLPSRPGVEEE